MAAAEQGDVVAFCCQLGWVGLVVQHGAVVRLTAGHADARLAYAAMGMNGWRTNKPGREVRAIIRLLERYAAGEPVPLDHVPVSFGEVSLFRRAVWDACRQIPYGRTATYAQLGCAAGFSHAARAVGGAMAANPVPLIIPCHRVIRSDGGLGGYSGARSVAMKRWLLDMEAREVAKGRAERGE